MRPLVEVFSTRPVRECDTRAAKTHSCPVYTLLPVDIPTVCLIIRYFAAGGYSNSVSHCTILCCQWVFQQFISHYRILCHRWIFRRAFVSIYDTLLSVDIPIVCLNIRYSAASRYSNSLYLIIGYFAVDGYSKEPSSQYTILCCRRIFQRVCVSIYDTLLSADNPNSVSEYTSLCCWWIFQFVSIYIICRWWIFQTVCLNIRSFAVGEYSGVLLPSCSLQV